ncbi:O-acetyl-ADP-ribose deacetylase [Terriglobus roseus]|uniref:O-acetyl-ADP-ribose deacetylase (Regulator of RNase III), contains Macro domain n=1 Tax=Terriglobus roseus TaxID=392734 RepID=A0A1H4RTY6_9BACT|nr:O-acetyl-ADP-ribose deacetylase [Terriglobus roseus]SEC35363.1 O-acetyl-ADP-ribose deacetylase (regulator of RNase III), contains Macro domain [Terriglobus roseus]
MAELEVIRGDITKLAVDAIVNAANTKLKGGGGVDGAIHRAAGKAHLLAATAPLGGCATGDAKATPGFNLPATWIFHTAGPVWSVKRGGKTAEDAKDALLRSCYRRCMELAREHNVRSIAFPAISTGVYRFPPNRAAGIAIATVREHLQASGVERAIFCCYNEATEAIYRALLA